MKAVPILAISKTKTIYFESYNEAAERTGVSESTIRDKIKNGKSVKGWYFDEAFEI